MTSRNSAAKLRSHIASAAPVAVDKDGVSAGKVDRERRIFDEQARARASRKP